MLLVLLIVCLFGISVFFFKQKTAYEMRISDWSSDVCSSDLDDARAFFRCGLGRTLGVGRAIRHRRTTTGRSPATFTALGTTVGRTWPNGRASCRERVCQYV